MGECPEPPLLSAMVYARRSALAQLNQQRSNMRRKQWISGLKLFVVGMSGHFKKNRKRINIDAIWLDSRQYKRFRRAEAIANSISMPIIGYHGKPEV